MKDLTSSLTERHARSLYRQRRVLEGPTGPEAVLDNRVVLNFSSNDYLGLANHPAVVEAFVTGARRYGVGAGAAHLVTGHRTPHHALEEELATFTGRPRALLFSTGYMANLGIMGTLFGRHDRIYEDRLNHASLLDAAGYAGAPLTRYPHADTTVLEERLMQASPGRERLVVSDGVFSMDGDLAPLPELAAIARRYGAWLMVDDAHGIGILGEGRGTVAHYGLGSEEVPILMGTLGKALGTSGAFVAGTETLIETLIQEARPYIYTTATPPAVAEATRAALRIVDEEPWRREHLRALINRLQTGLRELHLSLLPSLTPIQPLILGTAARATAISEALLARNILISAIRPPTVPEGTARLRITLTAAHTLAQVDQLVEALGQIVMSEQLGTPLGTVFSPITL
ncbi:8-amino-7-oxononanoate synthase [Gammaproteobacteria bacterium]